MIGVTADTNVYISGLQFGGLPLQFLNQARSDEFLLAVSQPLLNEVWRVLRDKFQWRQDGLDDALARLARFTMLVHPMQTIDDGVPDDPDDNKVLECAVAAKSGYIVTGDNDLLRLGSYGGIRIVKVADFLKILPTL